MFKLTGKLTCHLLHIETSPNSITRTASQAIDESLESHHFNLIHMISYLAQWKEKENLAKAREIKAFLENNYQEMIDARLLVKKFGMNTNCLRAAFKTLTNATPHEYLTAIRIEHAKKLLQSTNLNIMLVATSVGLDKSNLYIHFKKLTGLTPAQWRENARVSKQPNACIKIGA